MTKKKEKGISGIIVGIPLILLGFVLVSTAQQLPTSNPFGFQLQEFSLFTSGFVVVLSGFAAIAVERVTYTGIKEFFFLLVLISATSGFVIGVGYVIWKAGAFLAGLII